MTVRILRSAVTFVLLAASLVACGQTPATERPEAVIMIIGDGFGVTHLSFTREFASGSNERLAVESMPVSTLMTTRSASHAVTDSAAAATTLATGQKVENRWVGLDAERNPLPTIADRARDEGWLIGLVTNTRVTHATPAAFYAHAHRYAEEEIAAQLLDPEARPDLLLGGGQANFLPEDQGGARTDDRDVLSEARAAGYTVWQRGDALDPSVDLPVLGVFANDHLAYGLDDQNLPEDRRDPSLTRLVDLALDKLGSTGSEFFLMIEGGRIDHAGHDFDPAGVAVETLAFDNMIARVIEYQKAHPGVLVLVTADHATGGIALNDFIDWQALKRQKASVEEMAGRIRSAGATAADLAEWTGYDDFTDDEIDQIVNAPYSNEARRRLGRQLGQRQGVTWLPRVGDETHGHTGEDVPFFAIGPGAEAFDKPLDNAEVVPILRGLLGWSDSSEPTG